jgi:hypothetical protein
MIWPDIHLLEHAASDFVVVRRFDSVNDGQGY